MSSIAARPLHPLSSLLPLCADKLRTLSSSFFRGILPSARRSSADSSQMDRGSLSSALRSSSDGRELTGSQNVDQPLRRTSVKFADEVEDKPAS